MKYQLKLVHDVFITKNVSKPNKYDNVLSKNRKPVKYYINPNSHSRALYAYNKILTLLEKIVFIQADDNNDNNIVREYYMYV